MGIFASKVAQKNPELQKYQVLAKQAKIELPKKPENKMGLLQKAGSFLSSFETAPAVLAIQKGENPFAEYGERVKQGVTLKEDIVTKPTYTSVLEEAGWKSAPGTGSLKESATWKNFSKEMLGLAGDILLDPTTYLTLGLGKGVALSGKAGNKVLTKTGEKVLSQTAQAASTKIAKDLAVKGIAQTPQELIEAGVKQASRQLYKSGAKELFDQGGVKFFGKTLVTTDAIKSPLSKVAELIKRPIKTIAEIAGEKLPVYTGEILNPKIVSNVIQDSKIQITGAVGDASPKLAEKLNSVATDKIKSWGDLYSKMTKAVGEDKAAVATIKNHLQTRWKDYIDEPEISTTLLGKEFVKTPILPKQPSVVIDKFNQIKEGIGKAFSRDYGLPEGYITEKQKFLDIYKNDADSIISDISKTFKATTKAEREAISTAIESGNFTKLSPKNTQLAEQAQQIFKDIAKKESERGLLESTLEDYVTHIYKDPAKAKKILAYLQTGVRGGETRFAKERVIPTLLEAEKLGLKPEKDIANILAARLMASAKAVREQDLLRGVAGKFGKSLKTQDVASMMVDDLVEYTNKEFKGLVIPRVVANDLEKIGKQVINNEELKGFLRGYDAIQNFFKGAVTTIFPAFHGRNFISNVAQNALDIGIKSVDPVSNLRAVNILREGTKGVLKTKFGAEYTYEALRKIMKEKQVLGSPGFFDIEDTLQKQLAKGLGRIKKYTPTQAMRKVGGGIEDHARALNFLTHLERGLSVEQAAKRTKQFLFDYANLSDFEKTVMRRAIPFYTWTRKNIELYGKQLLTTPRNVAMQLKAQRLGESETAKERAALPEYVAQGLALKVPSGWAKVLLTEQAKKSGLEFYMTGLGLPIENFFQNLPQGLSAKDMTNYLNKLGSQSAFLPKYVAEVATGHEFFRNRPIRDNYTASEYSEMPQFIKEFLELKEKKVDYVDKKGGRVNYSLWIGNPYKIHLLRSLPTSRLVSTAGSVNAEDLTTVGKLLKNTTGIKIAPIDVEKLEEKEMKDYLRQVEDTLVNYGVLAQFKKAYEPKKNKQSVFKK